MQFHSVVWGKAPPGGADAFESISFSVSDGGFRQKDNLSFAAFVRDSLQDFRREEEEGATAAAVAVASGAALLPAGHTGINC